MNIIKFIKDRLNGKSSAITLSEAASLPPIDVSVYLWPEEADLIKNTPQFEKAKNFCDEWSEKAWVNGHISFSKEADEKRKGTEQDIGLNAGGFGGSLDRISEVASNKDLYIVTNQQYRENYYESIGECELKHDFVKSLKPYTRENVVQALKEHPEEELNLAFIKEIDGKYVGREYVHSLQRYSKNYLIDSYKDLLQSIDNYIEKNSGSVQISLLEEIRGAKLIPEKAVNQ